MTKADGRAHGSCRVVGEEKFVSAAGGAAGICGAIEKAVAARVPNVAYKAEVRVLSKTAITADVVANGSKLPQQNMSVIDRNLGPGAIDSFARSLAEEMAKATKA